MNSSGIFSFDSPLWKFLGYIADAFWLTVLWAVCSLPVVTIGASTTALYASTLRMLRNEDNGITKRFFIDFKENLLQGSVAGIIMAAIGALIGINLYSFYGVSSETSKILAISMLIFAYVYMMLFKYIFAVIARFSNKLSNLFAMSFVMAVKYFGWTLLMITISISVLALSIFVFWPIILFSAGVISLFDSWILNKVFEKFITDNNIN